MIIADCRASVGDRRIEIIGTDLARDQVARARDGLYTQFEVQRGLPVQMLMRYFRKDESGWRISEAIRAMVQYREWNLLADLRQLGHFDVVFCRNVLIYFDQPTKAKVLGCRCPADAGRRTAVSRWSGNRVGNHQPLFSTGDRARCLRLVASEIRR